MPDLLLSEESEDYTTQFLEEIQKHPSLYDKSAELRRFKGRNEWNRMSSSLDSKFAPGKLKEYWVNLIKKYKLWHGTLDHFEIENDYIFKQMSFVQLYSPEEHLIDSDDHIIFEFVDESGANENYDKIYDEIIEEESDKEPEIKKIKYEEITFEPYEVRAEDSSASLNVQYNSENNLDEFDYFAKKVALQLRQIASKDRKSAKNCEIDILKVLMNYEEKS